MERFPNQTQTFQGQQGDFQEYLICLECQRHHQGTHRRATGECFVCDDMVHHATECPRQSVVLAAVGATVAARSACTTFAAASRRTTSRASRVAEERQLAAAGTGTTPGPPWSDRPTRLEGSKIGSSEASYPSCVGDWAGTST